MGCGGMRGCLTLARAIIIYVVHTWRPKDVWRNQWQRADNDPVAQIQGQAALVRFDHRQILWLEVFGQYNGLAQSVDRSPKPCSGTAVRSNVLRRLVLSLGLATVI